MATDKPWSGSPGGYSIEQWRRACLIDKGGNQDSKDNFSLPVKEPDGTVNANGVHAAAARLDQVDASPEKKAAAARALVHLYSQLNETAPDGVEKLAGQMSESREAESPQSSPLYNREAVVSAVDFAQRIITTIAVPYDQPALVPGGIGFGKPGEVWREIFCRSAFNGVEAAPHRVRVNRDHNRSRTVGKVVGFEDRSDGLVSTVRIAKTALGDETLALADERCLGASVSFRCGRSDQELDRFTLTRRVKRAYMDHLSFVENPAYDGAEVLSVREDLIVPEPATPPQTPAIDAFVADPVLQWAMNRTRK